MTRRRIVLFDQYFPPDTSATARIVDDFASVCHDEGVPLTIVCGYPSYDPASRPMWLPLRRETRGSTRRLVIGSTGFDRRNPIGRVLNYVTFMVGAALLLPFVTARRAFVVMTDPPMAPLLAWWARRVGRPATVSVWVQDLHPDFGVAAGLVKNGVATRAWRSALRAALRASDDVVVLGRDMARRVAEVGVTAPDHIVHNGWSGVVAESQPAVAVESLPLRVMHLGNIGFAGPWPSVLAAAERVQGVAEFVFVGGGAGETEFSDAPPNVSLIPRVPHEEVARLAAGADVLLVGVRKGLEGYVVPSKGYEMMALARPLLVVSVPDSEMRLLVDERGCGVAVDDDPDAIVAALAALAADRMQLASMGAAALAASEEFRRANQFAAFVRTLSPA